jgi:hypothetical protein
MSDYGDPHDPTYGHEPADHTRFLGLIAGLACLVIILGLGLALGVGYGPPTHVASHDAAPPQQTTLPAIPSTTPGLARRRRKLPIGPSTAARVFGTSF